MEIDPHAVVEPVVNWAILNDDRMFAASSFATAIQLNNEGVHSIVLGQYREALSAFLNGLSLLRNINNITLEDRESDCSEEPSCFLHFECHKDAVTKKEASDHATFVFKSPIIFRQHSLQQTSYDSLCFNMMYNIALSNHLLGMEGGLSLEALRKALAIYELAYNSQRRRGTSLPTMQVIAIMNNVGQINSVLQNQERANSCFNHLMTVIFSLVSRGRGQTIVQLDGFVSNLAPLLFKQPSSAPAA